MARFTRKSTIAVLATAFVLAAGGTAYAYWTQSGAGTGTATTGTTTALVVKQTSTVTGLFPGGTPVALAGNFDNPSAGPVGAGTVTASVTATDDVGCDPAWYAIGGTAVVNAVIPSGLAQGSWSGLTVGLLNDAANQDACKGAGITITYAVSAGA